MNDMVNTAELLYGGALLEIARDEGKLDAIGGEMASLGELLDANADLSRLLGSRIIPVEERAASVERIFKGKVSDLLYRFLQVVNKKNRMPDLPGIIRAFGKLYAEAQGVIEVDAIVASEMTKTKLNDMAKRIGDAIGKKVVPQQRVDESLIGGLKLRVGDQLIDGSVATQLKLMRQKMIETGREKARAAASE